MSEFYQLWSRRWQRVGSASADREALEAEAARIADEGSDTCVYVMGEDPNEDEEDDLEWCVE